ncbi:uncharacterized protein N7511_003789 [Penicillium nucicola]|uniref:uncharacterized protein n=1 Tax=Penicillium nucicola TaxID=1850975 RepID=UPI002544E41D|nr:uncharacterized protein N7511_003789 [Penicillium nucicola]KAJ5766173.1 hypothetical protein N7511_003789 [Penicillium nucicola]
MTLLPKYQAIITSGEENEEQARKRRLIYIRPFLVFWANSMIAEILFLTVAVLFFSGTREMIYKVIWTMILCPLGMSGALGGLTNYFLVDYYYGHKAVWFTAILTLLVLGSCNYLCFSLDHHFGYFGASTHPLWFHWRYPALWMAGWTSGKLLFTDEGQKKLASLGI